MSDRTPVSRGAGGLRAAGGIGRLPRGRRGMTLVEIMIAVTLLLFGLMGFTHAILRAVASNEVTRESAIAGEAARQMLETLQAAPFEQAFRLYNADAGDDPGGVGTAPGPGFDVPGLDPLPGDADGLVGEVVFPAPVGAPNQLREDTVNAALSMPRDLDGNGLIDGLDHSSDYRILPVLVRLEWQGTSGATRVEFRTMLGDYQ